MSSLNAQSHAQHRRRVSHKYLKAHIQNSRRMHGIISVVIFERLKPWLTCQSVSTRFTTIDVLALSSATGLDLVSGYIFGLKVAPNLLQNEETRQACFDMFGYSQSHTTMFWVQELPVMSNFVSWFLPRSESARKAALFLEDWCARLCTQAEAARSSQEPDTTLFPEVYAHLRKTVLGGDLADLSKEQELQIASELLDHLKATYDVFGITFTKAMYELSKHPQVQSNLRLELQSLRALTDDKGLILPTSEDIEALPILDAVVLETLRLRPTAPDGQPRIDRTESTNLVGITIPPNVRINTYPFLLHRIEAVFENPMMWDPTRWLSNGLRRGVSQCEHLWAFGVGSRACLGQHLTIHREYKELFLVGFR